MTSYDRLYTTRFWMLYLWCSVLSMDMGGSMFDRLEVETPMCPKSFELAMLGLETDTGMVCMYECM